MMMMMIRTDVPNDESDFTSARAIALFVAAFSFFLLLCTVGI